MKLPTWAKRLRYELRQWRREQQANLRRLRLENADFIDENEELRQQVVCLKAVNKSLHESIDAAVTAAYRAGHEEGRSVGFTNGQRMLLEFQGLAEGPEGYAG